jgi:hypothetical protein
MRKAPAKKAPVKRAPVKKAPVKKAPAKKVPAWPSVAELVNMDRLISTAMPSVAELVNMDRLISTAMPSVAELVNMDRLISAAMPSVAELVNMDRLISAAMPSVAELVNMDRLIERADTELLINSAVSTINLVAESLAPEVDLVSIERLADAVEVALPPFPLDSSDSAGRDVLGWSAQLDVGDETATLDGDPVEIDPEEARDRLRLHLEAVQGWLIRAALLIRAGAIRLNEQVDPFNKNVERYRRLFSNLVWLAVTIIVISALL